MRMGIPAHAHGDPSQCAWGTPVNAHGDPSPYTQTCPPARQPASPPTHMHRQAWKAWNRPTQPAAFEAAVAAASIGRLLLLKACRISGGANESAKHISLFRLL
jgi:hypothetical protein